MGQDQDLRVLGTAGPREQGKPTEIREPRTSHTRGEWRDAYTHAHLRKQIVDPRVHSEISRWIQAQGICPGA
jgi:hypothetical protein